MTKRRPDPLPWIYRWRTNLVQTPLFAVITAVFGSLALLATCSIASPGSGHEAACGPRARS